MRIHSLEFEDKTAGRVIKKINFDKLNLLVGISGAGKTQILKTLSKLANIAANDEVLDFEGHFIIKFSIDNMDKIAEDWAPKEIVWELTSVEIKSENELSHNSFLSSHSFGKRYFFIEKEIIQFDRENIIDRDKEHLLIKGEKQSSNFLVGEKSAIAILSLGELNMIKTNFLKIVSYYRQRQELSPVLFNGDLKRQIMTKDYKSFPPAFFKIVISFIPTLAQIYVVKKLNSELFQDLIFDLQNIFPSVEDIDVMETENGILNLAVKENGKLLNKDSVSSGLLKTIYIVTVVRFSIGNTVVLLDEIENGLGINCLDEITQYIIQSADITNSQFILTSHHPYIINQISESNWKIISQKNGVISSASAQDIGIDTVNNRQEKFFQLMNYWNRQ